MSEGQEYMKASLTKHPTLRQREGAIARSIEQQTAKIPSDFFLWSAMGAMGISLLCKVTGKEKEANYIAHWVPTILILGVYN